jgi:hypothetical protein
MGRAEAAMTTKRQWKARALAAETKAHLPEPLTFTTLTVCFSKRTISFRGNTIHAPEDFTADCVTFPVTNNETLLVDDGWYPVYPVPGK